MEKKNDKDTKGAYRHEKDNLCTKIGRSGFNVGAWPGSTVHYNEYSDSGKDALPYAHSYFTVRISVRRPLWVIGRFPYSVIQKHVIRNADYGSDSGMYGI